MIWGGSRKQGVRMDVARVQTGSERERCGPSGLDVYIWEKSMLTEIGHSVLRPGAIISLDRIIGVEIG